MLILTRHAQKPHEDPSGAVQSGDKSVLLIGDDINTPLIEITVTEIRGDQVRIGIRAPREITVHRTEVYKQIIAEIEANSTPQK